MSTSKTRRTLMLMDAVLGEVPPLPDGTEWTKQGALVFNASLEALWCELLDEQAAAAAKMRAAVEAEMEEFYRENPHCRPEIEWLPPIYLESEAGEMTWVV